MAHEAQHVPFETITAADVDRIHALIEQGILLDGTGIKQALYGSISIEDLSPVLQGLLAPIEATKTFVGDGGTVDFPLNAVPLGDSESVYLDGILQERNIEYTMAGLIIHFLVAPMIGDKITVKAKSAQAFELFKIGSYNMGQSSIEEIACNSYNLFVYGFNGGVREVAKYEPITMSQVGSAVPVDPGISFTPNHNLMVQTLDGGIDYLWVAGSPSGTEYVTKIRMSDMSVVADIQVGSAASQIVSLATDGANVYAFAKGGAPANTIYVIPKTYPTTGVITSIATGLTTVGDVYMAISLAGYLYVAYSSIGVGTGQVRKYNVILGTLLQTFVFYTPRRLAAINDKIYVMDILPTTAYTRLHQISATDVPTDIIDLPFTCTNMIYDGSDLWMSKDVRLLKLNILGTILQYEDDVLDIRSIGLGIGSVWTGLDNSMIATPNITRYFPGIPGI